MIGILANEDVYRGFFKQTKAVQEEVKRSIKQGYIKISRKKTLDVFKTEDSKCKEQYVTKDSCFNGEKEQLTGDVDAEHCDTIPSNPRANEVLQVDVYPADSSPEGVELENKSLQQINTCDDLPDLNNKLKHFGTKCDSVRHSSLSITVLCSSIESLELLWTTYKNGSLAQIVQSDILRNVKVRKFGVKELKLRIIIERWRYRKCKLDLAVLGQGESSSPDGTGEICLAEESKNHIDHDQINAPENIGDCCYFGPDLCIVAIVIFIVMAVICVVLVASLRRKGPSTATFATPTGPNIKS
ncbi:uncharacterized protein [Ptychodera flava]|uniref:uncharacterized protein n=1 Tax=Ptychodera flava TaxID=63121 RepID=UPI00396AA093